MREQFIDFLIRNFTFHRARIRIEIFHQGIHIPHWMFQEKFKILKD